MIHFGVSNSYVSSYGQAVCCRTYELSLILRHFYCRVACNFLR
uniref:Uncharacterized protein n=1 Tax=Arundo donax TaxID=35708 RepID=A0A0A8ZDL3_ARUDO